MAQQYSGASVGLGSLAAGSAAPQLPCILFGGTSINPNLGPTSCGTFFTTYQTLGDNGSALDPTTSYQVFVDIVKSAGRHTLKLPFDGRQYRLSVQNVQPETLGSLNSQEVNSSNALSNSEGFSATDAFTATTNNYLTPANTFSKPLPPFAGTTSTTSTPRC